MSKKDVSVEFAGDEVIITKHADTPEARETVEALRRAIEGFNKNDPDFTAGAYEPGDDDEEGDKNETETETELSPREQARRRRQLAERIAERGRLESTRKLLKGHTPMIDSDTLISEISKRQGLGLAMIDRFVAKGLGDELTEHQIVSLATSDLGGAAEFAKRYQGTDALGRMLREACTKARDAAWFKPTVETGERALAETSRPRNERADPLRERIIRDKAVASPFLSQEQLAAYADAMVAELERTARGRARPGTMERV
jgi:hypothetical protein